MNENRSRTKVWREPESPIPKAEKLRLEAERDERAAADHAEAYRDVIEALERAGIDPGRLRDWLLECGK